MSNVYKYTWKHGISMLSNLSVSFRQPLSEGMAFVDLFTGDVYRVHSLHKAKEGDRYIEQMPEDVVHTFPMRTLSDEELSTVRRKHKYEPQEDSKPHDSFAILE
jgi:hypothetical protein